MCYGTSISRQEPHDDDRSGTLSGGQGEDAVAMPNRDLKESNRRSPSLQLLSDAAERLWYRLITSVDDFGRLEADPEVVFTTCFQRVPTGWTAQKVRRALEELATKAVEGDRPLIAIYKVGARMYLQILSSPAHIYCRAKHSKYPPQENQYLTENCAHLPTDGGIRTQILSIPDTPNPEVPSPEIPKPRTSGGEPTQAQATGRLEDFQVTPELEAWSAKEGISNPGEYVEEFKDFWRSTGGKRKNGQAVKDWTAAFRNRLRYLKMHGLLKKPDWKTQFCEEAQV